MQFVDAKKNVCLVASNALRNGGLFVPISFEICLNAKKEMQPESHQRTETGDLERW